MDSSEENLLQRSTQGEERAFVQLIRRYRPVLAGYIRSRINSPDDAEDVLQETLIAAWRSLAQLRAPKSVRAWLLQVAANRCRDYFKARGRREMPADERDLETHASRFGMRRYRYARMVMDAVEALEAIPAAERETAKRFYLDGLSIAEIAAVTESPPGTIKRRLFQARNSMRQALGVPLRERSLDMAGKTERTNDLGFPSQRPEIVITKRDAPPFSVNCPELRWWSIIPLAGQQASFACYEPPDWKLTEVEAMRVVRPAKVHDLEGVEIEVRSWEIETGWQAPWTLFGRLTDQQAKYMARLVLEDGVEVLQTFRDDLFEWNWGEMDRLLEDRGEFIQEADGAIRRTEPIATKAGGAGIYEVQIGERAFTCLRVFEIEGDVNDKGAPMTEHYLTREGRTVLTRHYCHPDFKAVAEFKVIVDESSRFVVDGVRFVHWYDTIPHLAL